MLIRQVWTSHNGRHEGGRVTHALPLKFDGMTDGASVFCGADLTHLISQSGELREIPSEQLEFYVDCQRCLRVLRKQPSTPETALSKD